MLIIGGREDKDHHPRILQRFIALCRQTGRPGPIGIVTTAAEDGALAYGRYAKAFAALGVPTRPFLVWAREQADAAEVAEGLRHVAGVFFSGGDQLRITSTLGGTVFHRRLLAERAAGLVVAGTSAGASMMSDVMIVGGAEEAGPTKNRVQLAAGMGLWPGSVIDQHFSQRGRIGRLLAALAQNPAVLAIGIDEDTAVEVDGTGAWLTVVGSNTVTVLDGQGILATNASESRPDQPLALVGVRLHVLAPGWSLDLAYRRPRPPVSAPHSAS